VSRLLGCWICNPLLLWCDLAYAQQDNIYLDYVAAVGCPSRSEFVAQVKARTALAQFVDDASTGRRFTVSARFEGGRAVGRFTSGRGAMSGTARQVTSESCEDVVSALALIAALAIDPHANLAEPLPPSGPDASSASTMSSDVTSNAGANQPVSHSASSGSSSPIAPNSPTRVERASGTGVRYSSWQIGLTANGTLWASSPVMPVGGLSVMVQWQSLEEQGLSPALRLSVGRAVSATAHLDTGGGARFTSSTARLDLCALRINLGHSIALQPCVGIEGGWITATGVKQDPIVGTQEWTRPWWAVNEMLRMQVELGKGWSYGLEAGLAEPLWRDTFVFDYPAPAPGSARYQVEIIHVPAWAPQMGTGVARRFW
jgi:hypothetical protein